MKGTPLCVGRAARAWSPTESGLKNDAQLNVQFFRVPTRNSFTTVGDSVETNEPVSTRGARVRFAEAVQDDWRVGTPRLGILPAGRR